VVLAVSITDPFNFTVILPAVEHDKKIFVRLRFLLVGQVTLNTCTALPGFVVAVPRSCLGSPTRSDNRTMVPPADTMVGIN
jgi:hypothetical protein